MPEISRFYGLIVRMFYREGDRHHGPHVHVEYAGQKASVEIGTGEILAGRLPKTAHKLVQEWLALHEAAVRANWDRARRHEPILPVEPLE